MLRSIVESHPGLPCYWRHGDTMLLSPAGASPEVEDVHSIRRQFHSVAAKVGSPKPYRKIDGESKHLYKAGCGLDNRVHTCLVTSPVRKPLLQFTSHIEKRG